MKLSADNWLFLVIVAVCGIFGWMLDTADVSDQERNEMLNDEELWP
jgi:hypothetical protein